MSQKSFALSTLFLAAFLALFLPMTQVAQAQQSANRNASPNPAPIVRTFFDGGDDRSARITADASGNFYIASDLGAVHDNNAFGVLKYSAQGKLLGAFHFNPSTLSAGFANDVKVDGNGNIYAGGFSSFGGLVISFDSSGNTRWMQFLGDDVIRLALDQSGNVYAAGNGINSMLVAKYTANGDVLWTKSHQGTAQQFCDQGAIPGCVTDLQIDSSGNVLVFGLTANANPTADATTLKLDSLGNVLWFRNFTQPGDFNMIPAVGAIDNSNSIYVTGQGVNPFTGERFNFTVKYDTNGNQIFALTGSGTTGSGIGGMAVAVDPTGDIRLTGTTLLQGEEITSVSKLDPTGKTIWITQVAGLTGLVNDSLGNSFVYGSSGAPDYTVSKLNSAGKILWTFSLPTKLTIPEMTGAVVDPLGNLVITGFGLPAGTGVDQIVTLKLAKNFKPN